MSREDIGKGGALRRGVSFVSQLLGKHNWEFNLRRAINDSSGVYAWTFDIDQLDGNENEKMLITARASRKGRWWSVTDELQKIVVENDAWLVAYFDLPQEAFVVDPEKVDHINKGARFGRDTYEYDIKLFPSLESWITTRKLRERQKEL